MNYLRKTTTCTLPALTAVAGLLFAHCTTKNESKPTPKPITAANKKANVDARKKWETTPEGKKYVAWRASADGKKIQASYDKIEKYLKTSAEMEAQVTSVNFVRENTNSTGPKWIIIKINGAEYMMQFTSREFQQLSSLKVNDKIIIKSHYAGFSHNHPYLIVSCDFLSKDNKVLFKRDLSKNNGC